MSINSIKCNNNVPMHVAIIMDGNRRWAKKHAMDVHKSHEIGAKRIEEVLQSARDIGVKCLTIYGFSMDNWYRDVDEVSHILYLIKHYLHSDYVERLVKQKVRIKIIGDIGKFDDDIVSKIHELERRTECHKDFLFQLALSYSARNEIVRAARDLCKDILQNIIAPTSLDEELFGSYLDTDCAPALDFVIRTGGEIRLSNFMLWQSAYAEFHFVDVMWPDFGRDCFLDAVAEYQLRERRYGR